MTGINVTLTADPLKALVQRRVQVLDRWCRAAAAAKGDTLTKLALHGQLYEMLLLAAYLQIEVETSTPLPPDSLATARVYPETTP